MGERYAKKLVTKHIATTATVAAVGTLTVYFGDKASSTGAEIVGLLLVGLSPLISYIVTLKVFARR
ncbi:MAG: hypothetical protein F7C07_07425 [Desulfurococcales archaeon]|nr:hypothetical protein [Desulfurococcales archaeon]